MDTAIRISLDGYCYTEMAIQTMLYGYYYTGIAKLRLGSTLYDFGVVFFDILGICWGCVLDMCWICLGYVLILLAYVLTCFGICLTFGLTIF